MNKERACGHGETNLEPKVLVPQPENFTSEFSVHRGALMCSMVVRKISHTVNSLFNVVTI